MGDAIHDPACDVLGCGVEVEATVEVLMVQVSVYEGFHFREVHQHAVLVKFLCFAIDGHNPVVAMQVLALALA